MEIKLIKIKKSREDANVIIGHSHFIKTVEDIYEVLMTTVPNIKFGIGFCESSGPCLVRSEGNDEALKALAQKNALQIGAGHCFVIFIEGAYPINVLNAIKQVPEVCSVFCASANPVELIVAETSQGRGILGVIDGLKPKGVEQELDINKRRKFLRKLGYKL